MQKNSGSAYAKGNPTYNVVGQIEAYPDKSISTQDKAKSIITGTSSREVKYDEMRPELTNKSSVESSQPKSDTQDKSVITDFTFADIGTSSREVKYDEMRPELTKRSSVESSLPEPDTPSITSGWFFSSPCSCL